MTHPSSSAGEEDFIRGFKEGVKACIGTLAYHRGLKVTRKIMEELKPEVTHGAAPGEQRGETLLVAEESCNHHAPGRPDCLICHPQEGQPLERECVFCGFKWFPKIDDEPCGGYCNSSQHSHHAHEQTPGCIGWYPKAKLPEATLEKYPAKAQQEKVRQEKEFWDGEVEFFERPSQEERPLPASELFAGLEPVPDGAETYSDFVEAQLSRQESAEDAWNRAGRDWRTGMSEISKVMIGAVCFGFMLGNIFGKWIAGSKKL